ncbi:hypothetical protein ACHAC9_24015 [Massilia sp. CMS3.1]|uniref:hypothetical protein n=1 Tax=Massilia sp. CMS3.1 TaxID=3373083 RepID=UPI003EE62D0F
MPSIRALATSLCFLATLFTGCAMSPKIAEHGFSFGTNFQVEIMDYMYGAPIGMPTQPPRDAVRRGHVSQGTGMAGNFVVGEYLYVKWRVKQDGTIIDRKIDLKQLLPANMDGKEIHFNFLGQELNVYVIDLERLHAPNSPHCPALAYKIFQCITVYPIMQKNF